MIFFTHYFSSGNGPKETDFYSSQVDSHVKICSLLCQEYLKSICAKARWAHGQLETCPTSNRLHCQGMAYNNNAITWKHILGTDHSKPCYNFNGAVVYTSKPETKIDGPWEFGLRPKPQVYEKAEDKPTNEDLYNLFKEFKLYTQVLEGHMTPFSYNANMKAFQMI